MNLFLDQQFTVTLNITSQEYQDAMSDRESFEFLNFAETFQKMVRTRLSIKH